MPRGIRHVPTPETRQKVALLTAFGIEQEHIAAEIGLNGVKALRRHYAQEIETGTARMLAKVAGALFKRAVDPKSGHSGTVAGIFIMKARGGWRDQFQKLEIEGQGQPAVLPAPVNVFLPENGRDAPSGMSVIDATPKRGALPKPA